MKNILVFFAFILSYSLYAVSEPPVPFSDGPGPPPPNTDLNTNVYIFILIIGAVFIALCSTLNKTRRK